MTASILDVCGLTKHYRSADGGELVVLDGVDLQIGVGETCAIVGRSGSGKSTLLALCAGLDTATRGTVRLVVGSGIAG